MAEDKQKPTLLLIATGGTISMLRDPQTGQSVATRTATDLLAQTSLARTVKARGVDLAEKRGPSRQPADLLALAHCIQQEAQSDALDGIVVCQHGNHGIARARV